MKCKKAIALITLCLVIFTIYCFNYGITGIGAHDSSSSTRIGIGVGNFTLENVTTANAEPELSQEIGLTDSSVLESTITQEETPINYAFLAALILLLITCGIALYTNGDTRASKIRRMRINH